MPELPEVELARRGLARWLGKATITRARAEDRLVVKGAPGAFARALAGRTVMRVERRGKRLRIALDDGALVFSHLGMSGRWVARAVDAPAEKWERARIDVVKRGRATSARYVDPRRLGRIVVAREDIAGWRELGPDPLLDGLDARALHARLAKKNRAIKEALMDQTLVAGVGNIYATEALFRARIDPRARTGALSVADVAAIARGVRASMEKVLREEEGEIGYVNEGAPNRFLVYGRAGAPCPRCGTTLARIVLGGRGTVFCPRCQRR